MNNEQTPPWNVAVVPAAEPSSPSRAEFEQLKQLVETLSMRVHVQSQTIDTLIKRIDQAKE